MDIQTLTQGLKIGEIFAYGYAGSQLYGLNTAESDTDIAIITTGKGRDRQYIWGDIDLRIYPLDMLMKRLWDSALPETDLIFSRSLTFTNDERYSAFLNGFRPNSYRYFWNSDTLALKHMPRINENIMEERRQYKALKASIRSIMLGWKMLDQGSDFNPIFDDREKEIYWEMMEDFPKRCQNGESWENIYKSAHDEARKLRNM